MKTFDNRFYKETLNNEKPTLINKLNIHNYDELQKTELTYTIKNIFNISDTTIPGEWDYRHLAEYHKAIFEDLYDWAGKRREFGVVKYEEVLSGASVEYTEPLLIVPTIEHHLNKFKNTDFSKLEHQEKTTLFCDTLVGVWQSHPFNEGNTRTITKFMVDAAKSKGLEINSVLFGENSDYFRRALVVYTYDRKHYLENIISDAIQQGERKQLISRKDLPFLVYNFIKGNVAKDKLINKTFNIEKDSYQIIDIKKTPGLAQADAIIENCNTQEKFLEKNFAGTNELKLNLNKPVNDTLSLSAKQEKTLDK